MWLVTVVTPLSPQILTQRTRKTVAVTKMNGVDVETGTHESVATAVKGQGLVVKASNTTQELNDQNPSASAPRLVEVTPSLVSFTSLRCGVILPAILIVSGSQRYALP